MAQKNCLRCPKICSEGVKGSHRGVSYCGALQAGLIEINVSGAERGKQYIIESTGTGVAIFDYDNDGLPDIFLVNGAP